MEFWQRVHWFVTSGCNQKCKFCFKPDFKPGNGKNIENLAEIISENKVKEVIFTGGEPLLAEGLYSGLKILHNNKVDISLHTNGTLLENFDYSLVNEIAVPLDSMDEEMQDYLRGVKHFQNIKKAFEQLQDKKLRIGIHTVATDLNISGIHKIYSFLKNKRFDYWRIYEYNFDLANKFGSLKNYQDALMLKGNAASEDDGGVNDLLAEFLLMEEKMGKYNDKRVQFVGVRDYSREPYFFLNSLGEIYFSSWFSQGKRTFIGNVFDEGFKDVRRKIIKAHEKGIGYDLESFVERMNDMPLWARAAWEGNYFSEELWEINPRYNKRFLHLSELYLGRLKKQGEAPKDAEPAFD